VIASSNDGASEFVRQGENGYRVLDCEDVDAFGEFAALLADPKLRAELSSGAAEFKRSWTDVGYELIEAVIQ
jgi:glycosyltransferase involved in cell wall biosynthesis